MKTQKTSCNLKTLALQTVGVIIENLPGEILMEKNSSPLNPPKPNIKVTAKFGVDGSGSHQIRRQQDKDEESCLQAKKNYLGAFWCPLQIEVDSKIVWENPIPNSILYSRPILLVREKEDRESIRKHFQPIIVDEKKLEENQVRVLDITQKLPLRYTANFL